MCCIFPNLMRGTVQVYNTIAVVVTINIILNFNNWKSNNDEVKAVDMKSAVFLGREQSGHRVVHKSELVIRPSAVDWHQVDIILA